MIEFKGSHFEREVILWGVRWYVAYPISYRQLEEMMDERGVEVDHSTLNRWVLKYVPLLEAQFRARKRPVGSSWRMDETYVKDKGVWTGATRLQDCKRARSPPYAEHARENGTVGQHPTAGCADREDRRLRAARRELPSSQQVVREAVEAYPEQVAAPVALVMAKRKGR